MTMKLSTLISISDSYTDEVLSTTKAILYANEVIAIINSKFALELPFFTDTATEYTYTDPETNTEQPVLNDTWMRRLFVPYLNYSVKMNDSSLNEAAEYKSNFYEALTEFGDKYLDILDDALLTGDLAGYYTIDTTNAIDPGWFNSRGLGGL